MRQRHSSYRMRQSVPPKRRRFSGKVLLAALVMLMVVGGGVGGAYALKVHNNKTVAAVVPARHEAKLAKAKPAPAPVKKAVTQPKVVATPVVAPKPVPSGPCAGVTLAKELVVSIGQRHLWACNGTKEVYSSAVVTGQEKLAADLTPTGSYKIYGKQTSLYLDGSDSTGSWHDFVHYWMPFLSNQYGVYGLHDATWRKDSDFGNISPYSTDASHGCVELPLATATWIYDWAPIGTTITIES